MKQTTIGIPGYYGLMAMVMNVARTAVPQGNPLPQQIRPTG